MKEESEVKEENEKKRNRNRKRMKKRMEEMEEAKRKGTDGLETKQNKESHSTLLNSSIAVLRFSNSLDTFKSKNHNTPVSLCRQYYFKC